MMKMKKINVTETIVAGIQLHIVQNGLRGSVIFLVMYPHQEGEVEHFWEANLFEAGVDIIFAKKKEMDFMQFLLILGVCK